MKKILSLLTVCALILCLFGCAGKGSQPAEETEKEDSQEAGSADPAGNGSEETDDTQEEQAETPEESNSVRMIVLTDDQVLLDGSEVGEDTSSDVYLSHDIVYYEDRDAYESGNPYGDGDAEDRHTAEEAAENVVVNIASAGTYRISGTLSSGQIRVDLGEDASSDPASAVTLILDGADITCTVAPAVLFRNVYECDGEWNAETASSEIDTTEAGANVIIADGSVNVIRGSHVAKIYKDADGEKKLWKQDGAFYSYMSMNIDGEESGDGILTIEADNEGLDTELHLTINGGNIRILSQDDGINTNEDGVSVTTINGGTLHILAGLGSEGDGIDSNGWLVINGGTVISSAHPASDAGLDSDMGSYVNGGTVIALGSTMDWPESDSGQVTMNLQFAARQNAGDAIVVTDTDETIVFAYDPSEDEVVSGHARQYQGAVISCPDFKVGETYHLYIGGTLSGTERSGVYEAGEVTSYADGVRQVYTGTDVRGMGGFPGGFPGNAPGSQGGWQERPDSAGPGGMQEPPDGAMPDGQVPIDGNETPVGDPPEPPAGADGQGMPDFSPSDTGEITDIGSSSAEFFMQDKVNGFSGITGET